jgi:GGDEF domain-containing protein
MKTDETNLPLNPRPLKPERAVGPVAPAAGVHPKTDDERERDALDDWRERSRGEQRDPVRIHGFDPEAETVQTRAVIDAFSADLAHLHEALEAAELRLERAETARRLDPVTGLLRRDALLSEIPHLEALDRREGVASEIAILSVDGLPALREAEGRAAAERAMDALGRALAEAVVGGEPAGRLGDGDFAVLLTGLRGQAARDHAESLAAALTTAIEASVETRGLRPGSVTVGLAVLDPMETPWEAIDRADHDIHRSRLGGPKR